MRRCCVFKATFREREKLSASFNESLNLIATFSEQFVTGNLDWFEGPYEWTPTQSTQTIPIIGKGASEDIIINPIPSNYGLITWDGAILTVS